MIHRMHLILILALVFLVPHVNAQIIHGKINLQFDEISVKIENLETGDTLQEQTTNGEFVFDIRNFPNEYFPGDKLKLEICDDVTCPRTSEIFNFTGRTHKKDFNVERCYSTIDAFIFYVATSETDLENIDTNQMHTDLIEDDNLRLHRISIENKGICPNQEIRLTLDISSVDVNYSDAFGINSIIIPPIEVNSSYELDFVNSSDLQIGSLIYTELFYEDTLNRTFNLAFIPLTYPGIWNINPSFENIGDQSFTVTGSLSVADSLGRISNTFKVFSKKEAQAVNFAEDTLTQITDSNTATMLIIIIIAIATFAIELRLAEKIEKQLKKVVSTVRKSGNEQTKELKGIVTSIKKSTKEQLKESKKFENEKRKNIINSLLMELKSNQELAKEFIRKEKEYMTKGTYPMIDFVTKTLDLTLSNYVIQDSKLNIGLNSIRNLFDVCNNFLKQCRIPIGDSKQNMGKIIINLKGAISSIDKTIKSIENYKIMLK